MADKETGLNIPIGAVADKKSAEQAVKDITKQVDSSLKDGRIEIPVELKAPLKGASDDLIKAQEDVIKKWEEASKKGFSSSSKEVNALIDSYTNFKRLVGQAHKSNMTQVKDLDAIISKKVQSLKVEKTARRAEQKANLAKAVKKQKNKRNYIDTGTITTEEIQDAIKKDTNRKLKGIKTTLPRGYKRNSGFDTGVATSRTVMATEYGGSYEVKGARQAALNEARARKEDAKTLKTRINKEEANKLANEALTKGRNKNLFTSAEKAKGISNSILPELAKILGGIENGRPDASQEKFFQMLEALFKLDQEAGQKTFDSVMSKINMTLHKYYNTEGTLGVGKGIDKDAGTYAPKVVSTLQGLLEEIKKREDKIIKEFATLEKINEKTTKTTKTVSKSSGVEENSFANKIINQLTNDNQAQVQKLAEVTNAIDNQTNYDKIENVAERVADSKEQRIDKENKDINRDTAKTVKSDATTGFNTDSKADELINLVRSILNILQGEKIQNVTQHALPPGRDTVQSLSEIFKDAIKSGLSKEEAYQKVADVSNERKGKNIILERQVTNESKPLQGLTGKTLPYENKVDKSTIYASPFRQGFWKSLEGAFESLIGVTKKYEEVLKANADEQDKMAAERIKTYGLNNGRNPNDTGDIAGMRRILQLYRTNKASIEQNPELAQKIRLTPGRNVDTTELTKALNKALSGRGMRNAQNGGGFLKNVLGFATGGIGYAFMPSLEKTRAQADGLNQIMGNINKSLQSVLINIQTKETELAGMEARGDVRFNKEGYIEKGTSAAYKTLADLEEEKLVLDSIKADLLANDEIIKRTGGRFSSLVKNLNYTSPVLKENNGILRNINSGLDKNGKALKFQTRLAEILNYTFQLMSRSVGQMFKNWMVQLNPITQIKKAFQDFMSYNVKWQRTMNVVKYNLRSIIQPFMDKIAQFLVNCIGFLDIISMKIQKAFGKVPVSLFDQAAADAEKMNEEISSVSAGFDELHDIGSDSTGANDLFGEIYKPQLSKEWEDLANKIGDLFAGVITGDLGFGEVMGKILEIAWDGLKIIGGYIWDFIKNTVWPLIKDNWLEILAWVAGAFLGWKFLKTVGNILFNAIFGKITASSVGGLLSKVGGWLSSGFSVLFSKGGIIGAFKTGGASLGSIFAASLISVISIALGGFILADALEGATDIANYNAGVKAAGGSKKDQKSDFGKQLEGAAGGAMIGAGIGSFVPVIGTGLGAIIGGIVGALSVDLKGAFETVEIASRNANNEMQKIEYYEGYAKIAKTQVEKLNDAFEISNETIKTQTEKVYDLGEKYGMSNSHINDLVQSMKDGNYTSELAVGWNEELVIALDQLNQSYKTNKDLTDKLTEAKKKLLKADTDVAIAQDVEAGNFEAATARIELAEAQSVYSTEEATKKRIQLYKNAGDEERKNLLQNLTPEQRTLMAQYTDATDEELADLKKIWDQSSDDVRNALLDGVGEETQNAFKNRMNDIDRVVKEHSGVWQGISDTLREIFSFGMADTWTYNGEKMYYKKGYGSDYKTNEMNKVLQDNSLTEEEKKKKLKALGIKAYAVGTNYVPNDGLAYLHQGEAVVPKKYNQPYNAGLSNEEKVYMQQIMNTMKSLDNTMKQGIPVSGQFVQRGSDLVAVVNKTNSQTGANLLSNVSYAR